MTKNAMEKRFLFDQAVERHLAFKAAEVREVELARARAEARIREALDERNTFLAMLVDDEGFSVMDVTRITNSKNWNTAKAAIEDGREARRLAAPTDAEASQPAGPYTWNATTGLLGVTMDAADFDPYLAMLARRPSAEGEAWSFEYNGQRLLPVHADDDPTWEHPVVSVVMMPQIKAQAIAYIQSQK